jgi:hypothetical protein
MPELKAYFLLCQSCHPTVAVLTDAMILYLASWEAFGSPDPSDADICLAYLAKVALVRSAVRAPFLLQALGQKPLSKRVSVITLHAAR